jgi:hypothetical protein
MDEELDVVVTAFEVPERQAEAGLVHVFGLDAQHARRFIRELPVTAKRCPNRASADRYAQALVSIGARVELVPVSPPGDGDQAPRASISSLPIPAPSVMAKLRESIQVERETRRAIRRFRAAEGLDPESDDGALPPDIDPINPSIPKAPPLPRDLHRLPNGLRARPSDPPSSVWSDPLGLGPDVGGLLSERPRHADADPPPPLAGSRLSSREPGDGDSMRPTAIGLAHAATASIRPGMGPLSAFPQPMGRARKRKTRARWPLVFTALVAGYAGLRHAGILATDAERRARAWAAAGIEAGEHAAATDWLLQPSHRLADLEPGEARALVDRLMRAGARGVYVIAIDSESAAESSSSLLIELPDEAATRRILLFHAAKAQRLEPPLIPDHGERFYVLTWH